MTEIIDTTGEEIVPYLIHLSKIGIVPKILEIEGGFAMKMVRVEGPRLSDVLGSSSVSELEKIYATLGKNVAYVNKLGVMHSDLHNSNVIVENGLPVIIDWDKASMIPFEDDISFLTEDIKNELYIRKRDDLIVPLKKVLRSSYDAEKMLPLNISHKEIQERAYAEFGII